MRDHDHRGRSGCSSHGSEEVSAAAPTSVTRWQGAAYSTKRDGTSLATCDSEPVQTPGCVQAHGALLVLRAESLTVAQASENTDAVLGHAASALLERPLSDVVGPDRQVELAAFLKTAPTERNPIYVFTIPGGGGLALDVSVHTNGGGVLLEFEPAEEGGLGVSPAAPDYYALVKKTVTRLQATTGLQQFCDITTQEVRALTGMDRVMVYKFHDDGHGEVFAESRREDLPSWLGLHYPAGDIPQPVREVFKRIWLRPVPDVDGALAEMVPLVHPDSGLPVDMTDCALRGVSVMHTEYLKNIHVTAGVTMPIRRGDQLWGLIACHHYSGPRFLSYSLRAACEFVANVVSLQHQGAEDREHLRWQLQLEEVHRRLLAAVSPEGDLSQLVEGSTSLLDAVDAGQTGGAAIGQGGRWMCVGQTPSAEQLDELAKWLGEKPEFYSATDALFATDHLAAHYPGGEALLDVAAGLLALPLSHGQRSAIMWFRPQIPRTLNWGGNPHDKPLVAGPHGPRLSPRASFELFVESVRGRARPWQSAELKSAARLRVLLVEHVVARTEKLAALNEELIRSNDVLDSFSYVVSHDLKEPLRAINKQVQQLLDGVEQDAMHRRAKLESVVRLTVRMNGLLDSLMHFSQVGRATLNLVDCDLNQVVAEALEMVGSRAKDSETKFVLPRPLPHELCDWVRCREIYVNLISNALKYNDSAHKRVEIGWIAPDEGSPATSASPDAKGHAVYYVRDNGIGIDPKHFEQVFRMFKRLHGRDAYNGGSGAGLAIVKKLVDLHHGRVWVDSALGQGTTFFFTLRADRE